MTASPEPVSGDGRPPPVAPAQGAAGADAVRRSRPTIAFFDYPDLFEDFHGRYDLTQRGLVETPKIATGHHVFVALIQQTIGDVVWYLLSHDPEVDEGTQVVLGCRIRFVRASALYRLLWRLFWEPKPSWRWRGLYP